MQKQRIILIIGFVLGLAAVVMIKLYLDQQRQMIRELETKKIQKEQANQISVLVAKKDIPKGATIDKDLLETSIVPKQYLQPQAVTSLDRVAGMVVVVPIGKDEQITLSKLKWPKEETSKGGSLSMSTPVGKRAITISVDNVSSLLGMIKPGDYVDVISTMSIPVPTQDGKLVGQATVMPLFQNVLILAVGQEFGASSAAADRYKKEEKKEGVALITLALSPQEANLISFVQEQGKIRLVLRSPADSQSQPFQITTWDTLFNYVMPNREAAGADKTKSQRDETVYVEVYRGLSKEKMPLSK